MLGFVTASSGQKEADERGMKSNQGKQHCTFVRRLLQLADTSLIPPWLSVEKSSPGMGMS